MSPRRAGPEKTRFTMWLPNTMLADLERIQRASEKESVAEVIREAIAVYRDLLKSREDGVDLFFQDAKSGESGKIWLLPGPPPVGRRKPAKRR
ncbi:MAG: ribbon-helix-helix domain-containing protein [Pirellulaceae bacterium]